MNVLDVPNIDAPNPLMAVVQIFHFYFMLVNSYKGVKLKCCVTASLRSMLESCMRYAALVYASIACLSVFPIHSSIWDNLREWSDFNRHMRNEVRDAINAQQPKDENHACEPQTTMLLADIRGTIPQEIYDLRGFLSGATKFAAAGAQAPRGILLVGPPGTGKTSIARALANELNIPFISASGTDFVEMYVGVGPQRVRKLFEQARTTADKKHAQHVIIFIDEIDAIGTRDNQFDSTESHRTINELLVQMDGFKNDPRIIIMAATNRCELVDSALLRPGRFDYVIHIPLPDKATRLDILSYYLLDPKFNRSTSGPISLDVIAHKTDGLSGAFLENLINRAAVNAARANRTAITQTDLDAACTQMTTM